MSDKNVQTTTKQVIELTKEGMAELQQEVDELVNVKLPSVIDRVAQAREHGDLSENSEYQNAKDDQAITEARISEIKDILDRAVIVKQTTSHTQIGIGSSVVTHIKGKAAKKMTFHIVGEFEADPEEGKISSVSPLGKALMNKKKGDEVKVQAPVGEIVYIVDKIK